VKCVQAVAQGGRITAQLVDVPMPAPGAGEVLVRVHASGVNRADLSQIAGRYPPPPGESPILGLEISGRIVDSDEPVCALLGGGGHAEYVAVPIGQILPAPPSMDLVAAAGIPEAFLTAFLNLIVEAQLGAGQRALIHAGASGVGLAAIQVAKLAGAAVAATTRTRQKQAAMKAAGAGLAIVSSEADVAEEIERSWGSDAVDVALDPIGAATFEANLRLLRTGGRIIVIATMGGARTELDLSLLMKKRVRVIGSTLRARSREEKARLVGRFRTDMWPAFDSGGLRVSVDSIVPAARAEQAFQRLLDNASVGKVLITWSH
jgi:putative PIG3 family NAD(P)H quinone oxidoreductase